MAADEKDTEETTVYETDVQEGEPVVIRMPVDIRSVTLTVLAVLAGILMLQYAKPVFIPVILGTLISYVLGPAVTSMAKHGIPRVLGAFLVIVALCGTLGLRGVLADRRGRRHPRRCARRRLRSCATG